jgi:hypothetical protein
MEKAKAKRITEVKNSLDSVEEVRRRLPEVDAIYDDEIRESVIDYFLHCCPDYFWERPASATGKYHPPDESGDHGTWLHTKRVFATYSNLSESYAEMQIITEHDRNCGKAAALIHDTFNYGWPSDNRDMTTSKHDVIASSVAAYVGDLPEETVHLVHSHMGPWGEGKTPVDEHERLFHLSDMSAADSNHQPAVYYPAEELEKEFADLKVIEVEDGEYV